MRIILDTNVLWNRAALARLSGTGYDVIVPAVAFAERARQYKKRGWTIADLWKDMRNSQFEVESLGPDEAARFAASLIDDRAWVRLSRDALIAGHLREDDVLWTSNVADFLEVGVPQAQIVAV